MHSCGIWNDLELYEKDENKDACKRVQYDTFWYDILTCKENFESNEASDAFWDYCSTSFRGFDSATTPYIFIENLDVFIFLMFWDKV